LPKDDFTFSVQHGNEKSEWRLAIYICRTSRYAQASVSRDINGPLFNFTGNFVYLEFRLEQNVRNIATDPFRETCQFARRFKNSDTGTSKAAQLAATAEKPTA
jgi:hypothetical protein